MAGNDLSLYQTYNINDYTVSIYTDKKNTEVTDIKITNPNGVVIEDPKQKAQTLKSLGLAKIEDAADLTPVARFFSFAEQIAKYRAADVNDTSVLLAGDRIASGIDTCRKMDEMNDSYEIDAAWLQSVETFVETIQTQADNEVARLLAEARSTFAGGDQFGNAESLIALVIEHRIGLTHAEVQSAYALQKEIVRTNLDTHIKNFPRESRNYTGLLSHIDSKASLGQFAPDELATLKRNTLQNFYDETVVALEENYKNYKKSKSSDQTESLRQAVEQDKQAIRELAILLKIPPKETETLFKKYPTQ